jgi:predicted Zn-dependent peptidase
MQLKQTKCITRVLPNGLVINHVKSNFPGVFRLELIVRAGALDETREELGFAHFIEHLMSFFPSKKCPNSTANQKTFTTKDISLNAWTEPNTVGYYMSGACKYQKLITDMMIESYVDPILDPVVFEQEKNAVGTELSKLINSSSYPMEQVIDFVRFRNTNLAYTIQEEKDNVLNCATIENIMTFRDRLYRPEYTSIIISSNMEEQQANKCIDYIVSKWFSKGGKATPKNYNQKSSFGKTTVIYIPDTIHKTIHKTINIFPQQHQEEQPKEQHQERQTNCLENIPTNGIFYVQCDMDDQVDIQFHFPLNFDFFDDRIFYVDALETMLINGLGSRLYTGLRTKLGAVYHVGSDSHIDPRCKNMSSFIISTVTSCKKVKDVFDYIMFELEKLLYDTDKFITDDELSQYCSSIESSQIDEISSNSATKWLDYCKPYLLWGKPVRDINEVMNLRRNITIEKLKQVATDIFRPDSMSVFYSCASPILKTGTNSGIHYSVPIECVKKV